MAKPYWGIVNLVPDATITASSANSTYPATNLTGQRLWPGWRSAAKALKLNGTDECAWRADDSDFDILNSLTLQAAVKPASVTSGQMEIFSKFRTGSRSYALQICDAQPRLRLSSDGTSTAANCAPSGFSAQLDTYCRILAVFDGSTQTVKWFIDGVEYSNTVLVGAVPSSLFNGDANLTIGAMNTTDNSTWGNWFHGEIACPAIQAGYEDHGGYLNPSACQGYWKFNGNLEDSSGNGNTLTGNNLDDSNYVDCTAFQWLWFTFAESQQPGMCVIDRRHNLSTGATVKLLYGNLYNNYYVADSQTVTAGQAVVLEYSGGSGYSGWWLEIHDPDNSSGYIEIPHIYLGAKSGMERGFLRRYRHGQMILGTVIQDCGGGFTGYMRSEKLWSADLKFRCTSNDFSTIQAVSDEAGRMRPVIFSENGSPSKTRLVYLTNAMQGDYEHIITDSHFAGLKLVEAGGGI